MIVGMIRDLRYMRVKPAIPPAYKLSTLDVRTPIVNDQIMRLTANLTANRPRVHCPPSKPGPKGQENASHLERCGEALLKRLEKEAGKNLIYRYFDKAVEQGEGILKVILRMHRWDSYPSQKSDESDGDYIDRTDNYTKTALLPITMKILDRRNFYPWEDEDGKKFVIEVTHRRVDDILTQFNDKERTLGQQLRLIGLPTPDDASFTPESEVTLIEYWDRQYCVYILIPGNGLPESRSDGRYTRGDDRGLVLKWYEHGYPRLPYFTGYGEETSDDDPNYEGLSAAYPILYLAPFLDSLYTIWAHIGILTGFPQVVRNTPPHAQDTPFVEDSDAREPYMPIVPGKILQGPPGTRYDVLNYAPHTQAITGMIAEIRQLIQSAMLPSIMQGIPPGSRTAGYAIQELATAAKAKYQTTVRNGQNAIADALNFCLWLIENKLRQPIYLLQEKMDPTRGVRYKDYIKLTPQDINGYYALEVEIKPKNPSEVANDATLMANMKAAGAATTRQVIEAYGEEHPDEIVFEMMVEELQNAPEIKQFYLNRALTLAGMKPVLEQAQALQQVLGQQSAVLGQIMQNPSGAMSMMGGANGLSGGVQAPGVPAVTAPNSPAMQPPTGGPVAGEAFSGGRPAGPSGASMPRQYTPKRQGRVNLPQNQPSRGGIEGFRGR